MERKYKYSNYFNIYNKMLKRKAVFEKMMLIFRKRLLTF